MTEIEKVCGSCANHCRTSKYGSRGGSMKACRPEVMAWRKSIEGARLFTRDYKGYGPAIIATAPMTSSKRRWGRWPTRGTGCS